jgi:hypothetical protein
MEKLKIGDKVYHIKHKNSGAISYNLAHVERLTKTQAILSTGVRLINEPTENKSDNNIIGYYVFGNRWEKWHIQTPEILEEAKKHKEMQKISIWFSNKKFTDEEKKIIYNLFNEQN